MGVQNTVAKNYMSRNDIFAQLVNYYVFHGREAVRPTDLRSVDASEVLHTHKRLNWIAYIIA